MGTQQQSRFDPADASSADTKPRDAVEEALRHEHELSEAIVNTAQSIVLLLDTDGRILRFNPYLEQVTGWRLAEVQGHDWFDTFLFERDREQIRSLFNRAMSGERTRGNVNAIATKDGNERHIEWFDAPLTGANGELIGLLSTGQDITERRRTEVALRESDERLQAILNTAVDGIITIDRRGIIEGVNPATEKMFGYARQEMVGHNVAMLMPPPYCDEHDGYIARYLQTGEARIIGIGREVSGRRKDGSTFPLDLAVSEVDHLGLFTGVVRDISDRKELQKQVLEIAGEEDRRIGHELHDNIQQQLTGLGLLAASLAEALRDKSAPEAGMGERLAEGIKQATDDVHLLSRGLVPVEVDAEGLRAALSELASRITQQYGIQCNFQCEEAVELSDNFVATHLYRIAQEAVNNAIKHGCAEQIDLSLAGVDDSITLTVLDNGVGIGSPMDRGPGMGLRIMQYRAGLIGATVRITPEEQGGTRVVCTVLRRGSLR